MFDKFYTDYPGSKAIFSQLLDPITWSEVKKIDEIEYQIVDELAKFFYLC